MTRRIYTTVDPAAVEAMRVAMDAFAAAVGQTRETLFNSGRFVVSQPEGKFEIAIVEDDPVSGE